MEITQFQHPDRVSTWGKCQAGEQGRGMGSPTGTAARHARRACPCVEERQCAALGRRAVEPPWPPSCRWSGRTLPSAAPARPRLAPAFCGAPTRVAVIVAFVDTSDAGAGVRSMTRCARASCCFSSPTWRFRAAISDRYCVDAFLRGAVALRTSRRARRVISDFNSASMLAT